MLGAYWGSLGHSPDEHDLGLPVRGGTTGCGPGEGLVAGGGDGGGRSGEMGHGDSVIASSVPLPAAASALSGGGGGAAVEALSGPLSLHPAATAPAISGASSGRSGSGHMDWASSWNSACMPA